VLTSAYKAFRFGPEGMPPPYPAISAGHPQEVNEAARSEQLLLFIGGSDGKS